MNSWLLVTVWLFNVSSVLHYSNAGLIFCTLFQLWSQCACVTFCKTCDGKWITMHVQQYHCLVPANLIAQPPTWNYHTSGANRFSLSNIISPEFRIQPTCCGNIVCYANHRVYAPGNCDLHETILNVLQWNILHKNKSQAMSCTIRWRRFTDQQQSATFPSPKAIFLDNRYKASLAQDPTMLFSRAPGFNINVSSARPLTSSIP